MDLIELLNKIREGEGETTEFKRGFNAEAVKDIVAFLNTQGGTIIFGIDDNQKIIGLKEKDPKKIIEEKYIQKIFPIPRDINISVHEFNSKTIAVLELNTNKKNIFSHKKIAYIRIGSMSRSLAIEELVYRAAESLLTYFDSMPNLEAV